MSPLSVLFEDDELLIINKPASLAVQGGKGIFHSLDNELSEQVGYRVHLVHRLDKETSGILLVAKNSTAAAKWTNLIGQKEVVKEYLALCIGQPLIKGKPLSKGVFTTSVTAHGKTQNAKTDFEVLASGIVADLPLSLLRLTLGTGRMHQIRIQLAQNGCPIVADDQHGNFKLNKVLSKAGIKKLCLCAFRVTLPLKKEGVKTLSVPLPAHFQKALELSGMGDFHAD
ncbi:MAG TPA: RNA pseudouridine synthase [Treponema sp.]|nr:RNA pseudouridine synthase [Treponema sp.]